MASVGGDELVFRLRESLDVTLMVTQLMRHPFLADASENERNALVTVASELGTNIVKYAKFGTVSLRRRRTSDGLVVDVLADDTGPGIPDIPLALQDHFSTGNSLGLGLPAVRRMMDTLEIESTPAAGVRVVASKWINGCDEVKKSSAAPLVSQQPPYPMPFEVGNVIRPLDGQQACGDITYCRREPQGVLIGIFDGLGHGRSAAQAAQAACEVLDATPHLADIKGCFDAIDHALRTTVGAVGMLCYVDYRSSTARFAGVGNAIGMRVVRERSTLIAREGVIGQRLPSIFVQMLSLQPGDLLAFWTDGLATKGLSEYLALNSEKDLANLAQDAVREFERLYDDAGLLLFRWKGV